MAAIDTMADAPHRRQPELGRPSYDDEDDADTASLMGTSQASTVSSLFAGVCLGTSPPDAFNYQGKPNPYASLLASATAAAPAPASPRAPVTPTSAAGPAPPPLHDANGSFLQLSLSTLLGCSEMLGHQMEDRGDIGRQQDPALLSQLDAASRTPLRDASQRPLFVVAPLDVLVTREGGHNRFHIIEINGTGISGLTNMAEGAVEEVLKSFSELPAHLTDPGCLVLVASSGQETYPPVSRTLHEKVLYVEALRRGFEAAGRKASITNMSRLERRPEAMPPAAEGPTIVLGYMKQFRANFMLDGPSGRLMLFGRQVHAAINDRFVLNTCDQFGHRVDLAQLRALNAGFAAGADKGVAYQLYNEFFGEGPEADSGGDGGGGGVRYPCMATRINFRRARTRAELISVVHDWMRNGASSSGASPGEGLGAWGDGAGLARRGSSSSAGLGAAGANGGAPAAEVRRTAAVIKPQGTGCGHGIEFFFPQPHPSRTDIAAKVDRALHSVATNYNLQSGGLPYTVCEYLDTATIDGGAAARRSTDGVFPFAFSDDGAEGWEGEGQGQGGGADQAVSASAATKEGHKFELRVVVYRSGGELRAFPSIAKVAREPYDPAHPDNKKSLINNITTSAKETAQSGSEFLLPLACRASLAVLGISPGELAQLCGACTAFVRFVVDQVQDRPALFGLPEA